MYELIAGRTDIKVLMQSQHSSRERKERRKVRGREIREPWLPHDTSSLHCAGLWTRLHNISKWMETCAEDTHLKAAGSGVSVTSEGAAGPTSRC